MGNGLLIVIDTQSRVSRRSQLGSEFINVRPQTSGSQKVKMGFEALLLDSHSFSPTTADMAACVRSYSYAESCLSSQRLTC